MGQITDGTSHTYLIGEKYLDAEHYHTGIAHADNQYLFIGHDWDVNRWSHRSQTPMKDRAGFRHGNAFGSAHLTGFQMSFCDGSVRGVNYSVAPETHERHGSRHGQ